MTEAEWLRCKELQPMLDLLDSEMRERRSRLFAVACCRRIWHLILVEESRQSVEVAEQFADGVASAVELKAAIDASCRACDLPRDDLRSPWRTFVDARDQRSQSGSSY